MNPACFRCRFDWLHRLFSIFLAAALVTMFFPVTSRAADTTTTTESSKVVIGFVYDDSGSMFENGNTAWCQAKYGLETMAAMMGDNDIMRVFPLNSDQFEISGGTPENRVSTVHNQPLCCKDGDSANPPDRVTSAAEWVIDQCKADANARGYLIVATDGGFDSANGQSSESIISAAIQACKSKDIQVIYMAIGSAEKRIADSSYDNYIKMWQASTNSSDANSSSSGTNGTILQCMTSVAKTVFGWHELDPSSYDQNTGTLNLPVSAKKVTVFAQGEGSSIGSLDSYSKVSAKVNYTEAKDIANDVRTVIQADPVEDKSLVGEVATFKTLNGAAISSGNHSISVKGTSASFYYEPDVEIVATLTDSAGESHSIVEALDPGAYTVHFTVCDPNGDEPKDVTKDMGLKDATLKVKSSNGTVIASASEGETIQIEAGEYTATASGTILDSVNISTPYTVNVYNTVLNLSVASLADHDVTVEHAEECLQKATVTLDDGTVVCGDDVDISVEDSKMDWTKQVNDSDKTYTLTPTFKGNF